MIDLLGVGAPREDGGWRLHRVCASFRRGEAILVVSQLPEERHALLDAVAARIVPEEGRVWVAHVPVARDTIRKIRGMVADVDVHARPVEHRSLLWNVLVAGKSGHRALHGLLRLPRKSERLAARRALERVGLGGREVETASGFGAVDRARLALAGALVKTPDALAGARDRSRARRGEAADRARPAPVARASREADGAGRAPRRPPPRRGFADRLVAIADGLLVFDGAPAAFSGQRVAWRFGTA